MGDRANVRVLDGDSSVFLYTHWGGHDLPEIVKDALSCDVGKRRWNDAQYLARIIFCRMIGERDIMGETGYGITSVICDNEHPIITVDVAKQQVRLHNENDLDANPIDTKSFAEFTS